jgi:predicted phosphodiesterase
MRVAILSDIHANLAALEAVVSHVDDWKPDAVMVAGDVINRGPRPLECLRLIEERRARGGWRVIRGNHEDYVLSEANASPDRPEWERTLCQHTTWTYRKVRAELPSFAAWPERLDMPGGIVIMHASLKGNRVGIYSQMADAEMSELVDTGCAAYCVGHTHMPFVHRLGKTLVVNSGAVGMPFDGDPGACLAHLELENDKWRAELVRVPYDRSRTDRDYRESGYLEEGGLIVKLIYEEFKTARAKLGKWHRQFEKLVVANHITMEASVEEMLTSP